MTFATESLAVPRLLTAPMRRFAGTRTSTETQALARGACIALLLRRGDSVPTRLGTTHRSPDHPLRVGPRGGHDRRA